MFCGLAVAHTGAAGGPRPHVGYVRGFAQELESIGVKPARLAANPEHVAFLTAVGEAGIELVEETAGMDAAAAYADLLVSAMEEATTIRTPDLEQDDLSLVNRRRADGPIQ